METSLLICSANQWTAFYMIWTSVMKELKKNTVLEQKILSLSCKLILDRSDMSFGEKFPCSFRGGPFYDNAM